MNGKPVPIPVVAQQGNSACEDGAPVALMVLGDAMLPEFEEGEVIIVEPDGLVRDGSYVVAEHAGELYFRQIAQSGGGWLLHALNLDYHDLPLAGLECVKGVVIQKKKPGRRSVAKRYV